MPSWTSTEVRGKESSHSHLEDRSLARTRRGGNYHIIVRIHKELRYFGLQMVEGVELGSPKMRHWWTEDRVDRKHRSGLRRTAPRGQMMYSWFWPRAVGRWFVQRVVNEWPFVGLVLSWLLLLLEVVVCMGNRMILQRGFRCRSKFFVGAIV